MPRKDQNPSYGPDEPIQILTLIMESAIPESKAGRWEYESYEFFLGSTPESHF
jgi:hypothetical protein